MKKIWLNTVTPEQLMSVEVGDWIEGVGDILSLDQVKFIRKYGDCLYKLTKIIKDKKRYKVMNMDKFNKEYGFRVCEFCGCKTNAHIRACCNAGREADEKEAKNRIIDELKKDLNNIMSKYAFEELNRAADKIREEVNKVLETHSIPNAKTIVFRYVGKGGVIVVDIIFGEKHLVGKLSGKSVSIEEIRKSDKTKIEDHPKIKEFREFVGGLECTGQDDLPKRFDHAVVGIGTEAGELLTEYKKAMIYGIYDGNVNLLKLKDETCDLLHYFIMLTNLFGITLDELIELNIAKLKSRYPNGYSKESWINRNREKETEAMKKVDESK